MENIESSIVFDENYCKKLEKLSEYDSKLKFIDKQFSYGTSGFRYDEKELDRITFRVGIVTCLLSQINDGLPMGIIITASHNKYTDNGIKIAGLNGESLESKWENIYTVIINSKNLVEDIKIIIGKIYQNTNKNKYFFRDTTPVLNFAYDTRRSSEDLIRILTDSVEIYGAKYKIYGIQTSPALQFITLLNQISFKKVNFILSQFTFCNENEYWNFLEGMYMAFNHFYDQFYKVSKPDENKYESELLLDCANGAAGYQYQKISKVFNGTLRLDFINFNYKNYEFLNNKCGAEHVHKEKLIPINYPEGKFYSKNVSFDGDVDRIIYFVKENESDSIKIIDGDHLICLFGLTLKYLIEKLSKSLQVRFLQEIKIGVICTAYSNGAFMNYINNVLNFPLICAKTGVKHLHQKAKNFDIAIYFESNGHGTVYSNEEVLKKIQKLNCFIESSKDSQNLELISIFLSMFNRTTGDSLSALIAVESSLKLNNMNLNELYNIYTELESINVKVIVKNKNVFIPNEDDSRLIEPIEIQNKIDEIVKTYSNSIARCFVRPSGTEDIVRIYAEAATLQDAKCVAQIIKDCILEHYA